MRGPHLSRRILGLLAGPEDDALRQGNGALQPQSRDLAEGAVGRNAGSNEGMGKLEKQGSPPGEEGGRLSIDQPGHALGSEETFELLPVHDLLSH
jgi:hypothetical protein